VRITVVGAGAIGAYLDIAARVGSRPQISVERRMRGAAGVGHHKTSMLQDLEAGKQLELDAIVTAVVEIADITGAEAPTLRAVHAAVELLAQTRERARQQIPLQAR
jgi:2-dehydropantoate 2-reductase